MAKETFVRSKPHVNKLLEETSSTVSNTAESISNTIDHALSAVVQSSDTLMSVAEVLSKISG